MSLDKIQVLYSLFKIWLKAKYTKGFKAFEYLKAIANAKNIKNQSLTL